VRYSIKDKVVVIPLSVEKEADLMLQITDDLRITGLRPLIPPAILMEELPITDKAAQTVVEAREHTTAIIEGRDDRLFLVVGPCSIHDTEAALEYAGLLHKCADRLSDDLCVLMRVYFEKPRTTVGWKGLINDPYLDGSFAINHGLRKARRLLLDLGNMGVPVGTEFLDTITPQFTADLVSWGAIGARTTESQVHRELASGLSMPVGFKNGTEGNIQIAIDALRAARRPHHFLSVTKQGIAAIVATAGNESCHVVLRGSNAGSNYDQDTVEKVSQTLREANLPCRVMIDCSHGNSRKTHLNQPIVARTICAQLEAGSFNICGVMMESHLVEGQQSYTPGQPLTYGQSITDACMSWETTEPLLEELAMAVRHRRHRS
jgi:3-deoxy-7-phosphoheptulonate synthase